MSWFSNLRSRWGRKPPPVITTHIDGKEEKVTEWARRQASANMLADPEIKARVVARLQSQYGMEVGLAQAKIRYPEAF